MAVTLSHIDPLPIICRSNQTPASVSKARRLRAMIESPDLRFLMEAHNGLSAKIVEEAGFEGIWASGLSMSAALGVRDNNEASWTQVLEVLEFMADATSIPILVDGDTGYGNFNNFRRFVTKLCQRDIAGVCVEDKLFPKTNSFLGSHHPLAEIDEFCGKIKAGKDSQTDENFCIVARTEALVAGYPVGHALRRAEAYHAAGADAILIHSKKSTPDEVLAFCRQWDNRCPVVAVPTKYYATPTQRLRDAQVSVAIWANHNLRAAISAMRDVCRKLREQETLVNVEEEVARLGDVFALAGNEELELAEQTYIGPGAHTGAIILAASRGKGALAQLTQDRPKCMLDVRGVTLLRRQVRAFNDHGIRDITVVAGYRPDAIDIPEIEKVVNASHETTGELFSLACARHALKGPCIVSYGDIVFRAFLLSFLLKSDADVTLLVDPSWRPRNKGGGKLGSDLVTCSMPFTADFLDETAVELEEIGPQVTTVHGKWVGLLQLSERGARHVRETLEEMEDDGTLLRANISALLTRLIAAGTRPAVIYVTGSWVDVNDVFDLAQARNVS